MMTFMRSIIKKIYRESPVDKKNKEELEFLPAAIELLETPPPLAARAINWSLMAFFVIALIWSIFGEMDVVVVAEGVIQPSQKVKVIQALETSKVKEILVVDGQYILAGENLIELDPTAPESDRQQLQSEIIINELRLYRFNYLKGVISEFNDNDNEIGDFERIIKLHYHKLGGGDDALVELQIESFKDEYNRYISQDKRLISELEKSESTKILASTRLMGVKELSLLTEDRFNLDKKRFSLGSLSFSDWSQSKVEFTQAKSDYLSSVDALSEAEAGYKISESALSEYRNSSVANLIEQVEEIDKEVRSLKINLRKAIEREESRYIRSPVNGYVSQLKYHTVGGVVTPAEELMKVVPASAQLVVEASVLNKDIGFLTMGQAVKVKIDSFSYTKYGYIDGTILKISADAIADKDKGYYYPVVISLSKSEMLIGSGQVPLISGMTVVSDIKVGHRRVIDYFLTNFLEYQKESLRER